MEENDSEVVDDVQAIKQKGNDCVKENKFEEAILHYTKAIKIDPNNCALYSNRSFAFLRVNQHYLAFQDANETIRREPDWAKGYFRRAEVEAAAGLYEEALFSYGRALQLQPQDPNILEALKRITVTRNKTIQYNKKIPWLGACIGLILGIIIAICDNTLTTKPSFPNPLITVAFTMVIAGLGWGIGKVITARQQWSTGKTLIKPESENEMEENNEEGTQEKHTRYTKAQARQRYKKGKYS